VAGREGEPGGDGGRATTCWAASTTAGTLLAAASASMLASSRSLSGAFASHSSMLKDAIAWETHLSYDSYRSTVRNSTTFA